MILDAGAFIAFERGDAAVCDRIAAARRLEFELATIAPVIGQVWRDGRRQALLALLVASTRIYAPDLDAARRAGELLAKTRTTDIMDALVANLARDGDTLLTSDPADLRRLVAATRRRATVVGV